MLSTKNSSVYVCLPARPRDVVAHLHDVRLAVQRENVGRTPGRIRQVDGGDLSSTTGHLGCILEQWSSLIGPDHSRYGALIG